MLDPTAQIRLFVKLKLTNCANCARAGNRAGLLLARNFGDRMIVGRPGWLRGPPRHWRRTVAVLQAKFPCEIPLFFTMSRI